MLKGRLCNMKASVKYTVIISFIFSLIISVACTGNVVHAAGKTPKLNTRTLNIVKNSKYNLRVYNTLDSYTVTFESDDTRIVSVRQTKNTSCKIIPKASGSTTITAYVYDDNDEPVAELICSVTVSPRAASVKFNKKKYKLPVGTTRKIKAIIKPNISNENPLYSSDDTSVATVSSNGTVTALTKGQTTIRAYISNGKESSYTLTVTSPVDNGSNTPDNMPEPSPSVSPESSYNKPKDSRTNKKNNEPKEPVSDKKSPDSLS